MPHVFELHDQGLTAIVIGKDYEEARELASQQDSRGNWKQSNVWMIGIATRDATSRVVTIGPGLWEELVSTKAETKSNGWAIQVSSAFLWTLFPSLVIRVRQMTMRWYNALTRMFT